MKKIYCDESFFKNDSENTFYWAGFIAADGNLGERNNKAKNKVVSLSQSDKIVIQNFLNDIKDNGRKISERKYKTLKGENTMYAAQISSEEMFNDLSRFGIVPVKSKILEFPEWLASHSLVNHFIRGYFDGDGSVYIQKNSKYIEFRGTVSFLSTINEIIKSKIMLKTKAEVRVHSNCGSLKYAGNNLVPMVGEYLYNNANLFLPRKKEKIFASKNES